ncbi:MAG: LutC/YkgG family protein [Armatimonadota bacterium]
MSREIVLERVRAALRTSADRSDDHATRESYDAHGADGGSPGLPVLPAPQFISDPVRLFIDRAQQVGVTVESVESIETAALAAAAMCERQQVRRAAIWCCEDLAPVADCLRAIGVHVLLPGATTDEVAQADLGVTGVEWGIAETGTLVLASGPDQPRLASLLPPVHLAVLRADRIVPDLAALFAQIGPLPSAFAFVTGPSRSADIGMVPVLGAHGPNQVAILLVQR